MLQSALTGEVYFPARSWNEGAVERRRCSAVFTVTSSEEPRSDSESSPLLSSRLGEGSTVEPPGADPTWASCWLELLTSDDSTLLGGSETFFWHVAHRCNSHTVCPRMGGKMLSQFCFLFFLMLALMPWVNKHCYLFCFDSGQVTPRLPFSPYDVCSNRIKLKIIIIIKFILFWHANNIVKLCLVKLRILKNVLTPNMI